MRIEIIRNIYSSDKEAKPLEREVYEFFIRADWHSNLKIILERYAFETRETSRKRNWDVQKAYNRVGYGNGYFPDQKIPFDEVPLPDSIVQQAKCRLYDHIKELPVEEKY